MNDVNSLRRVTVGVVAILATVTMLVGCSRDVEGAARKAGAGGNNSRNDDSQQTYPNLQKECDVLADDVLAQAVGADPLDIQSTFVGAICRWQALNQSGLIDLTRFWFEQGSLDNERKVAQALNYQIESRSVAGVQSIVMKPNDASGACGVASDAAGVVGWWVNPQAPGMDACGVAVKLMELTLNTNN